MFKKCFPLFIIFLVIWTITKTHFEHYDHPPAFQIQNFPLIEQPDEITCGPTSALMVLQFYGKKVTLKDVESATKTRWFQYREQVFGLTSPDYIVHAMKESQVPASQQFGTIDKLKYYVSQGCPVIVLLRTGKFLWHYAVVVAYNADSITIADPAGGLLWDVPLQHFEDSWKFIADLDGKSLRVACSLCQGTGRWLPVIFGPLGICELCAGTGQIPDYIKQFVTDADVYPNTMIAPKDFLAD